MSLEAAVYVATALAGTVVVSTRLRLRGDRRHGRYRTSRVLDNVHTIAGALALVTWIVFLGVDEDAAVGGPLTGIIALGFWWVTVLAGLTSLVRWLPARGRHSTAAGNVRSRRSGPSVLAQVALLVAVLVLTYAYLVAAV